MKRLLVISALGVGLLIAACVPPPPPVPHDNWYYTEVQVQPASPSGTYEFHTVCALEGGGTFDHPDTIAHTAGQDTSLKFNWSSPGNGLGTRGDGTTAPAPAADPQSCSVTETTPTMNGTTPTYWLNHQVSGGFFGTPPTYVPITAPTSTPQTCQLSLLGTYQNASPPLDIWDCFFAVSNA